MTDNWRIAMQTRTLPALAAAVLLAGCATSQQLTLMPRDSGKLYQGVADHGPDGEGRIRITVEDKTYTGTWVNTSPERTTGFVTGTLGFGLGGWRRGGFGGLGLGTTVTLDNPEGVHSKALLTAPDGSGMRCDLRSGGYGRGGGTCRDDRGREYDVQLRATPKT